LEQIQCPSARAELTQDIFGRSCGANARLKVSSLTHGRAFTTAGAQLASHYSLYDATSANDPAAAFRRTSKCGNSRARIERNNSTMAEVGVRSFLRARWRRQKADDTRPGQQTLAVSFRRVHGKIKRERASRLIFFDGVLMQKGLVVQVLCVF
jgi:hypothetical protein